jgi:hypothetical protein
VGDVPLARLKPNKEKHYVRRKMPNRGIITPKSIKCFVCQFYEPCTVRRFSSGSLWVVIIVSRHLEILVYDAFTIKACLTRTHRTKTIPLFYLIRYAYVAYRTLRVVVRKGSFPGMQRFDDRTLASNSNPNLWPLSFSESLSLDSSFVLKMV